MYPMNKNKNYMLCIVPENTNKTNYYQESKLNK